MPGASFGISAKECKTGAKLAEVKGTICESCYALKGRYVMPNVKNAHNARLAEYNHDAIAWINKIAFAIAVSCKRNDDDRFRWFDSGDVQSLEMLEDIAEVCRKTPNVRHWLPTKEYGIVKAYLAKHGAFPSNLNVRLSAYKIDQQAPALFGLTGSGVVSDKAKSNCHAYSNPDKTVNCGTCDACWNPDVAAVYYPAH